MDLVIGTLVLRPYVFVFLLAFVASGALDLGWKRTSLFGLWVWAVAWLAEFSSTRIGIPFGLYHYTEATRGRELYIANVPFMDSLSFVFLAYAAFCLARAALGRHASGTATVLLGGTLMMALDVVIDPLAVRGDRWFLGRIFYYPDGGVYFGVPLSNFAGWLVVGIVGLGGYVVFVKSAGGRQPRYGVALYYGVLAFNLAVTAWIGERWLGVVGLLLHSVLAVVLWYRNGSAGAPMALGERGTQSA
ncbi:MAG: carotenoid biosynthesis protein [Candidatus Rokuibacteriota bacterium]|nr:MAG: carotenoid biosynthesis protein [Candidatus Rokubacteria bacterium]